MLLFIIWNWIGGLKYLKFHITVKSPTSETQTLGFPIKTSAVSPVRFVGMYSIFSSLFPQGLGDWFAQIAPPSPQMKWNWDSHLAVGTGQWVGGRLYASFMVKNDINNSNCSIFINQSKVLSHNVQGLEEVRPTNQMSWPCRLQLLGPTSS